MFDCLKAGQMVKSVVSVQGLVVKLAKPYFCKPLMKGIITWG